MKIKDMGFFILAVLIGLLFAFHRWGDSGHAIGVISADGGKARHPVIMTSGKNHYSQITTLSVRPPFCGDVRIVMEGSPSLDYEIHLARPFIDWGFTRLPELKGKTLCSLKAGDRLALWTLIKPMKKDSAGRTDNFKPDVSVQGRYSLSFYDTATGYPVLKVPLIFEDREKRYERTNH